MQTVKMFFLMTIALIVSGCGVIGGGMDQYNVLIDKDQNCLQAWADIDANLQRRADLIPNLVEVVKGYAAHEQTTLTAVQEARSAATQVKLVQGPGQDDFSDPAAMAKFQAAQGGLSQALGKLMAVQEAYPNLKANEQFSTLMVQIESTENRILQARRVYNAAVGSYNSELLRIKGAVLNKITGQPFHARVYFGADANAQVAPKVSFSSPAASH